MSIYRLNMLFHGGDGDQRISEAIAWLDGRAVPEGQTPAKMARRYAGFRVQDGHLWHGERRVVSAEERPSLLRAAYENDVRVHGKGIVSLYKLVSSHYLNITRADIADFLAQNAAYGIGRAPPPRVNKPVVSAHPNSLWALDLIDCNEYLGSNRGHRYIMTVVDIFSRFVWLARLRTKEAPSVAAAFASVCDRAGVRPDSLLSDNGGEFAGAFDDTLRDLGIRHRRTRSHSPEANGICERRNMEVRKILRSIMLSNGNRVWYTHLPGVEAAINSTYCGPIRATPVDVWWPQKTKISRRQLPPAVADRDPRLKAQLAIKSRVTREILRFRAHDYSEGDHVRVKMATIFSQVRALVKAKRGKELIATYSPDVFVVVHVVRPRNQTLERRRYVVRNLRTGHVLTTPKGGGHYQAWGSDLIPADPDDKPDVSMADALRLNGCEPSATDLIY